MDMIELFREKIYEPLGKILEEEGDAGFVKKGPALVAEVYKEHPDMFTNLTTKHAEEGYTRKKVICDNERHAVRCMEWAPDGVSAIHEHEGRPCFDIMLEGSLEVTDYIPEKVTEGKEHYHMNVLRKYTAHKGDFVVVDPFSDKTETHKVESVGGRAKSLHFYPKDHPSFGIYKETDEEGIFERIQYNAPDD